MSTGARFGHFRSLAVAGAVGLLLAACARGTPAPVDYRHGVSAKPIPRNEILVIAPIPAEKPTPPRARAPGPARIAMRPAQKPRIASPVPRHRAGTGYHRVAPGETIYSISKRYGIQARTLVATNGLPAPYIIGVGQRLRVPVAAPAPRAFPAPGPAPRAKPAVAFANGVPLPQSKPAYWKPLAAPPPRSRELFAWPVRGRLLSGFGPKAGGLHNDGINIAAREGTAVHAAEAGVVAYVGNELRGFGNLLLVRHADGWMSAYAHVGKIAVRRGQTVRRGQVVARVGRTGRIDRPQLHFELRKGSQPVDPLRHLMGGERGLSRDARLDGRRGPG